jgi:hypothetical protein
LSEGIFILIESLPQLVGHAARIAKLKYRAVAEVLLDAHCPFLGIRIAITGVETEGRWNGGQLVQPGHRCLGYERCVVDGGVEVERRNIALELKLVDVGVVEVNAIPNASYRSGAGLKCQAQARTETSLVRLHHTRGKEVGGGVYVRKKDCRNITGNLVKGDQAGIGIEHAGQSILLHKGRGVLPL